MGSHFIITPSRMPGEEQKVYKGLNGIAADYTAVSTVGKAEAGLTYRGYPIEDLAEHAEFEEVAFLLIRGYLPSQAELNDYKMTLAKYRSLPAALCSAIELLPASAHPMDVLRTAASVLGCIEAESSAADTAKNAERLMGCFSSVMCYWHHWTLHKVRIAFNTNPGDNMATAFLKMLRNDGCEPDPLHVKVVNGAFILYAEHDFNASTFAARVVCSTKSDTYSAICAAIGALRGPLHGGANEAVMYLLEPFKTVEQGLSAVRQMLANKQLIMGFGHRIYKNGDPRNAVFKALSRELSERPEGKKVLFEISDKVEAMMASEKKTYPNADFFAASAYHQAGVPTHFFTPLFVVARTAGWTAHLLEQQNGNKIIRPTSAYNGPAKRPYVKIANRTSSKL